MDHVDVYHGVRVEDPYRWLEDEDSPETREWIKEENELTFDYLRRIGDRDRIRERLETLWNFERYGIPTRNGGRLFYSRNDGLQDQYVLYVRDGLDGEPRVLIDPNTLSEDGTIALSGRWASPDGRLMAYSLSSAGSDWRQFKVRDVDTGQDLTADDLHWIKFSSANWTADSRGFFYSRMPEPDPGKAMTAVNEKMRVCFHRIGTSQREDTVVYERPDHPQWGLYPWVTDDGRYLGIYVSDRTTVNNAVFLKDLEANGPVVEVLKDFDAQYWPIGNEGSLLYVVTDKGAPNRRIVTIDVNDPREENWKTLVPEGKYAIEDAYVIGGRLLVHTLRRAQSQLNLYGLDGTPQGAITLPRPGSVYFSQAGPGRQEQRDFYFMFQSFLDPPTIYHYDVDTAALQVWKRPKVDFDPDRFVTKQVAYISKDGTAVTMFISYRKQKKWKLDGEHPTLLYGYGGFNASERPWFSVQNLVWMEMDGVFAVPNLRGGGEYGEAWHRAGMLAKKQNVFDDFIAAAEGLIANGYTRPEHLAISGASNGGLLVGACMTQRPDLFGACLPAVGVMDMLRFQNFTIGHAWVSEYGSSEDPEMFKVLYAYSPYHRLRPGVAYPATLITTADHDDRVVPLHSFKFAARLQACQAGPAPCLIRIETKAGHGAGMPVSKAIDLAADEWAFLAKNLDMDISRRFWK